MKIGLLIAEGKTKLVEAEAMTKKKYDNLNGRLLCPSCGTEIGLVFRDNLTKEFIANPNMKHELCIRRYRKSFYIPIRKDYFKILTREDKELYLNNICKEFIKLTNLPVYKIYRCQLLAFNNNLNFNNNDSLAFEVFDILSFLRSPQKGIFIVGEVIGYTKTNSYMYIDLVRAFVPISIYLKGKALNDFYYKYKNNFTHTTKKCSIVIVVFVDNVENKNGAGINIRVTDSNLIKVVNIC